MGLNTILKIEKEAYRLYKKYGKEKAQMEAILVAECYLDEINNEKHYDKEKIDTLTYQKNFWLSVSSEISKINIPELS